MVTTRLSNESAAQDRVSPVLVVGAAAVAALLVRAAPLTGTPSSIAHARTTLVAFALLLPVVVSLLLLRRGGRGAAPLVVSAAGFLLFAPRMVDFDVTNGLIATSALAADEIGPAAFTADLALLVYSVALAGGLMLTDRVRPPQPGRGRTDPGRDVRVGLAVAVGLVASLGAIVEGIRLGAEARDFGSASTIGPLALLSAGPVAAALWLAGQRWLSAVLLTLSVVGPLLVGGRQSVLTPLIYMFFAVLVVRRRSARAPIRARTVVVLAVAVALVMTAAVTAATSRRIEVATELNDGLRPSGYELLVLDQGLYDPLVVAMARERRLQGPETYQRSLAIPVPRLLWPDKPLSYDFDFRRRHFPAYEGAIPITLVGTSFLAFSFVGLVLAGLLLAVGSLAADRLLWQAHARPVLLGVALLLFIVDVVRIGGLYREVLTLGLDVAVILVLTRPAGGQA